MELLSFRPEYDAKVIGQNLRRLRKEQKYTVEQIRDYLCLGTVQAVYKWEQGNGFPQADTMFALMELYNVNVKDLTVAFEADNNREEDGDKPSSSVLKQDRVFCNQKYDIVIVVDSRRESAAYALAIREANYRCECYK